MCSLSLSGSAKAQAYDDCYYIRQVDLNNCRQQYIDCNNAGGTTCQSDWTACKADAQDSYNLCEAADCSHYPDNINCPHPTALYQRRQKRYNGNLFAALLMAKLREPEQAKATVLPANLVTVPSAPLLPEPRMSKE